MPCRRCSHCAINYPSQPLISSCHVCGDDLSYFNSEAHHDDWEERVAIALRVPEQTKEERNITSQRLYRLLEASPDMPLEEALTLAADHKGVDVHRAIAMLKQGCKPDTLVAILL